MSRSEPGGHVVVEVYCGHCGGELALGGHDGCARKLALEPPRYCTQCRRRMVVQVIPRSWVATCVEHGEVTSGG